MKSQKNASEPSNLFLTINSFANQLYQTGKLRCYGTLGSDHGFRFSCWSDAISTFTSTYLERDKLWITTETKHIFAIPKGVSMSQYYMFNGVDHFKVLYRKTIGNFRRWIFSCDNFITRDIVQSVYFKFYSGHSVNWRKYLF